MKKRLLVVVTALAAAVSLVGCSGKISNDMITISQYKGLEVKEVPSVEITDADVEASIQSTLEIMATRNEITDRPVQLGDVVTIDYVGKIDGVAFERGADEDEELEIGAGAFIPGFEEGIIGHNVGEVFDINVTFPEAYTAELAGKDAVFTITLDKITEVIVPELTDELVTQLSTTATTVEEYKAQEKENLQLSNDQSAESQFSQNVWQALIENCELKDYAQEDMDATLASIESQYSMAASYYGMDVDAVVQQIHGITVDEMAKNLLKQKYAVELIAEKEGIKVTAEEYDTELAAYAIQYGYSDPAEFEQQVGHDTLEKMMIQQKVGEWLIENCERVE